MISREENWKRAITGIDTLEGDRSQLALKMACYGAKFLDDHQLLDTRRSVNSLQDSDLITGTPGKLIGKGTSATVRKLDLPKRPGYAPNGYVVKTCTLRTDADAQSAARTIFMPLLKSAPIAPIVGFSEPSPNVLAIYQEAQPYTLADVFEGLHEEMKGSNWQNALFSFSHALQEYVTTIDTMNRLGIVNRDLKPDDTGLEIVQTERSRMYNQTLFDTGEVLATNGLLARMDDTQINHLNQSNAFNPLYAPQYVLEAHLNDDENTLRTMRPGYQVASLGHIIHRIIADAPYTVPQGEPKEVVRAVLETRSAYEADPYPELVNEELARFLSITQKALDEDAVFAGKYTLHQMKRDIDQETLRIAMDILPELGDRFELYTPAERAATLPNPNTTIYGNATIHTSPPSRPVETIKSNNTIRANNTLKYETK